MGCWVDCRSQTFHCDVTDVLCWWWSGLYYQIILCWILEITIKVIWDVKSLAMRKWTLLHDSSGRHLSILRFFDVLVYYSIYYCTVRKCYTQFIVTKNLQVFDITWMCHAYVQILVQHICTMHCLTVYACAFVIKCVVPLDNIIAVLYFSSMW